MKMYGANVKSVEITLEAYNGLIKGDTGSPQGELETLKIMNTALKDNVPIFIKDKKTGKLYKQTNKGLLEVNSPE
jgi:hypothetical protein